VLIQCTEQIHIAKLCCCPQFLSWKLNRYWSNFVQRIYTRSCHTLNSGFYGYGATCRLNEAETHLWRWHIVQKFVRVVNIGLLFSFSLSVFFSEVGLKPAIFFGMTFPWNKHGGQWIKWNRWDRTWRIILLQTGVHVANPGLAYLPFMPFGVFRIGNAGRQGGGRSSVVDIATRYELEGSRFKPRWGATFSVNIPTGPRFTQLLVKSLPGLFPGRQSDQGMALSAHSHIVPRLTF
jgi:hypothetical protein